MQHRTSLSPLQGTGWDAVSCFASAITTIDLKGFTWYQRGRGGSPKAHSEVHSQLALRSSAFMTVSADSTQLAQVPPFYLDDEMRSRRFCRSFVRCQPASWSLTEKQRFAVIGRCDACAPDRRQAEPRPNAVTAAGVEGSVGSGESRSRGRCEESSSCGSVTSGAERVADMWATSLPPKRQGPWRVVLSTNRSDLDDSVESVRSSLGALCDSAAGEATGTIGWPSGA